LRQIFVDTVNSLGSRISNQCQGLLTLLIKLVGYASGIKDDLRATQHYTADQGDKENPAKYAET
jgi:hypothetical protein